MYSLQTCLNKYDLSRLQLLLHDSCCADMCRGRRLGWHRSWTYGIY